MKTSDRLIVEKEIQQEKAEALGRTGERLERALKDLEALRNDIANLTCSDPALPLADTDRVAIEIADVLARYARLHEEARQLRHCLIIQREAVGLWKHGDVDRLYPVPPPLSGPGAPCREDRQ